MKLRVYLAVKEMKINEFSKLIDADPRYISGVVYGRYHPGKRLAKEIEKITEGQVTVEELRQEVMAQV